MVRRRRESLLMMSAFPFIHRYGLGTDTTHVKRATGCAFSPLDYPSRSFGTVSHARKPFGTPQLVGMNERRNRAGQPYRSLRGHPRDARPTFRRAHA